MLARKGGRDLTAALTSSSSSLPLGEKNLGRPKKDFKWTEEREQTPSLLSFVFSEKNKEDFCLVSF